MPTSLPQSSLTKAEYCRDTSSNPGAFWLLMAWAVAGLLFAALASFCGALGAIDELQPLILF